MLLVLALLLAIHIFNFADRFLITGLIGPLKAAFNVDDGFMGLLMGPYFVLLYVVMGIPMARLADRSSRVKIIAAGCLMWSACTFSTGFATEPWQLALARVGVGVGEAKAHPLAPRVALALQPIGVDRPRAGVVGRVEDRLFELAVARAILAGGARRR